MRQYRALWAFYWLIGVWMMGCSSSSDSPGDTGALSQSTRVSVMGPEMPVNRHTPLSWYGDPVEIVELEAQPLEGALPVWVKQEIQSQMQAKGFTFTDTQSRYQVVSAIVLGEGDAGVQAKEMFRLFPTLAGSSSSRHPKGTLLLGIWDSEQRKGVWRSAMQAFTHPDAPLAERQQRFSALLDKMLVKLEPGDG